MALVLVHALVLVMELVPVASAKVFPVILARLAVQVGRVSAHGLLDSLLEACRCGRHVTSQTGRVLLVIIIVVIVIFFTGAVVAV